VHRRGAALGRVAVPPRRRTVPRVRAGRLARPAAGPVPATRAAPGRAAAVVTGCRPVPPTRPTVELTVAELSPVPRSVHPPSLCLGLFAAARRGGRGGRGGFLGLMLPPPAAGRHHGVGGSGPCSCRGAFRRSPVGSVVTVRCAGRAGRATPRTGKLGQVCASA